MSSHAQIEAILEAWIDLVRGSSDEKRSDRLLEAYGALGRFVLGEALDGDDPGRGDSALASGPDRAPGESEPGGGRLLRRARAGVAAAIRREELTISRALDDLRCLVPTTLEVLETDGSRASASRAALSVSGVLDRSLLSIVRAVEAAATRAEREQAESLAAFTDQLSHELENRLGAARTAGQMLRPMGLDLEDLDLGRVGELVESSIEAALKTVQDVRDLVMQRVDPSGRVTRAAPLPRLVRGVIDDLAPTAFEAGVDVTMDEDIADCRVDSARFRLIVYNLVGNGIKYRDPRKSDRFVRIETESLARGEIALRVTDNGLGIPTEDLDDVFLPRSRGEGTEDVPGTGLGLAIVREAVDQIGGVIEVSSEVGAGTTFTVTFRPAEESAGGS